jgi:hypothetical protein
MSNTDYRMSKGQPSSFEIPCSTFDIQSFFRPTCGRMETVKASYNDETQVQ